MSVQPHGRCRRTSLTTLNTHTGRYAAPLEFAQSQRSVPGFSGRPLPTETSRLWSLKSTGEGQAKSTGRPAVARPARRRGVVHDASAPWSSSTYARRSQRPPGQIKRTPTPPPIVMLTRSTPQPHRTSGFGGPVNIITRPTYHRQITARVWRQAPTTPWIVKSQYSTSTPGSWPSISRFNTLAFLSSGDSPAPRW